MAATVNGNADGYESNTTILIIGSGNYPPSFSRKRDWNAGLHWRAPVPKSLLPLDLWDKIQSVQVDPYVPPAE